MPVITEARLAEGLPILCSPGILKGNTHHSITSFLTILNKPKTKIFPSKLMNRKLILALSRNGRFCLHFNLPKSPGFDLKNARSAKNLPSNPAWSNT
jgi:hypothetical protein